MLLPAVSSLQAASLVGKPSLRSLRVLSRLKESGFVRRISSALTLTACSVFVACGEPGSQRWNRVAIDRTIPGRDSLGWLGARSRPLREPLIVKDGDELREPGGVVLCEITGDAAFAKAGARPGDVVVVVGEQWLPLKEDPTLDLLLLVEQAVSGGKGSIDLKLMRDGRLESLQVELSGKTPLEVGLPVAVERFKAGLGAALQHLLALQQTNGGWIEKAADSELALTAISVLAFRAGGFGEDSADPASREALLRAEFRMNQLVADPAEKNAFEWALAICAQCEAVGPLPAAVLRAASPKILSVAFGQAPDGMPAGSFRAIHAGSPQELQELLASSGVEMQMITMDGHEVSTPDGDAITQTLPTSGGSARMSDMPALPKPDLNALLEQLDPQRCGRLQELEASLNRFVALQQEDGGFGATTLGGEDRLLTTSMALQAMGAVQRVGGKGSTQVIEKGCRFLRGLVEDGKVAAAVARGANRRTTAAHAASVAAAFRSLGCPDTDPFLKALTDYAEEHISDLLQVSSGLAFHLLNSAQLERRELLPWQKFYEAVRLHLVAWQEPNGRFALPKMKSPTQIEQSLAGEVLDTACGAWLLAAQEERLAVMLCKAENPFACAVDGEGKMQSAPEPELPKPEIPGDAIHVTDPAEVEKLLESMGVEGGIQDLLEKQGDPPVESVESPTDDGDHRPEQVQFRGEATALRHR